MTEGKPRRRRTLLMIEGRVKHAHKLLAALSVSLVEITQVLHDQADDLRKLRAAGRVASAALRSATRGKEEKKK